MRDAGAESFCLHITYQYESQCALSFSKEELKMILELDCYLNVDCWTDDVPNQLPEPTAPSGRGST